MEKLAIDVIQCVDIKSNVFSPKNFNFELRRTQPNQFHKIIEDITYHTMKYCREMLDKFGNTLSEKKLRYSKRNPSYESWCNIDRNIFFIDLGRWKSGQSDGGIWDNIENLTIKTCVTPLTIQFSYFEK